MKLKVFGIGSGGTTVLARLLPFVAVAFLALLSLAHAQAGDETLRPRWATTFTRDVWVVNTNVTPEYGVRRGAQGMPADLGTIDSVDTLHSKLLVLEGEPDRGATLHAIDSDLGAVVWQKTGIRLNRWRPFPSYLPGVRTSAYYAEIVGSLVLLSVTDGRSAGAGCSVGRELVALDLRDGRVIWCTSEVAGGDVTFVPLPERNTLLVWSATDADVSLLALDLRTGKGRWSQSLGVNGPDWRRVISYWTGLSRASARPPLQSNGLMCVIIAESGRLGPAVRPPGEAKIRILDVESGQVLWDAIEKLEGRKTWLSWTFSDNSLILTTGRLVMAYQLTSGKKAWSTPLEDVRSLRMARGEQRDVVLVDFDARNRLMAPTEQGTGLAALDSATGEMLWRDRAVRVLQPLDRVSSSVFVESGTGVRGLSVETGRDTWQLRPRFESRVRFVRQPQPDATVVQSASEIAAYTRDSQKPVYQLAIPRASRSMTRILVSAIVPALFIPVVVSAAVVASEVAMPGGGLGLSSREIAPQGQHAFFATGRGNASRLVAVNLTDGTRQTVAPYVWGEGEFSLGNLIDEAHGLVYVVSDKTLAAYSMQGDEAIHRRTHRSAELGRALEMSDRAVAMANAQQSEPARREASMSLPLLQAFATEPGSTPPELVLVYKALGDSHVLVRESGSALEWTEHTSDAIAAYERALDLLDATANAGLKTLRAEVQDRLGRLRGR